MGLYHSRFDLYMPLRWACNCGANFYKYGATPELGQVAIEYSFKLQLVLIGCRTFFGQTQDLFGG